MEKVEQAITKVFKEFIEIKPQSAPIQIQQGDLFFTAILTDKNNEDVLVYIPIDDILEKKEIK